MTVLCNFPHALGTGIIVSSKAVNAFPYHTHLNEIHAQLSDIIETFDHAFSRFREDSIVAAIAGGNRTSSNGQNFAEFPEYASALFDIYDAMVEATDGRFTPAVADNLVRWGYGPNWGSALESTNGTHPTRAQWGHNVWRTADEPHALHYAQPVRLDFGAAGKGFLVDLIAHALMNFGVHDFTINAGGDIFTTEHLTIGLENPWNFSQVVGTVDLQPGDALCASAPSRRHWTPLHTSREVHHIVDGLTGDNTHDVEATWVVIPQSACAPADTTSLAHPTAWADALSTALFMSDPESLYKFPLIPDFRCARVMENASAQQSVDWPGTFFTSA